MMIICSRWKKVFLCRTWEEAADGGGVEPGGAPFARCAAAGTPGAAHLLAQLDDGVPGVAGFCAVAVCAKLVAHGKLDHKDLLQDGP